MEDSDKKENIVSLSVRMPVELHIELSDYVNKIQSEARLRGVKQIPTKHSVIQVAIRDHLAKHAISPKEIPQSHEKLKKIVGVGAKGRKSVEESDKKQA